MRVARNSEGEFVTIKDAVQSEEYFCLDCNEKVFAKNKKILNRIRSVHFSHFGKGNCTGNLKTYLHEIAIQIIATSKSISLFSKDDFLIKGTQIPISTNVHGFIPDIIIKDYNQKEISIEIYVRHKTDDEKKEKINVANISAVEINLSGLSYDSDLDTIRYEVLDNIYNRTDLNPPEEKDFSTTSTIDNSNAWPWVIAGLITFFTIIFWPKIKRFFR